MVDLSDALAEAYASADPAVVILHTIELTHPSFAPIRLVADFDDLVANLERTDLEKAAGARAGQLVTFIGCPFSFSLPQVGEGRQELRVTIDNAGLQLMAMIESFDLSSTTPIQMAYRPYLSSDTTRPHMDPPLTLDVQSFSAAVNQVTCTCAHANWANRRFPRDIYTAEKFPGIAPRV